MGSEGAAALAAALPQCPHLNYLDVSWCELNEQAAAAFEALQSDGLFINASQHYNTTSDEGTSEDE